MNSRNLTLLIVISMLNIGCSKENDTIKRGIVIKGAISNGDIQGSLLKSTNSSDLTDATQVLAFNSSGGYEIYTIENSAFEARAMSGTATALAFLAADHSFIGCLHSGGLNVLPLVSLEDGENTVIDLSTLTLSGTRVIPANDPIGSVIGLNQEEIERYSQLGTFFESLSNNIDADHDGKPDLIDNKALYVSTIFDIYCGSWGLNDIAPQIIDASRLFVNYTIRVSGGKSAIPENPVITLYGPEGSPGAFTLQSNFATGPDCFISFFRRETMAPHGYPFGSAFLPFENGSYRLTLDNKEYSILYSNIDAEYFFILALPTVHTNDRNEIVSVTVEYKDVNGETVNPENFVYQTMVQLNGQNHNQLCQIGSLWENPEAKTNTELFQFVPPTQILASDLTRLTVCYLDLVGNAYNIGFDR